jgi:tetratricopeptide (TPR) repeat protein
MKKVFLLFAASVMLCINGIAQNDSKAKTLRDNIAKSDVAIKDEKKGINPSTWMSRGKLFHDAYGLNIIFLRIGMPTTEANLFFGKPKEATVSEANGAVTETYEYSRIKLNFEGGLLKNWEETTPVIEEPLTEAINAYEKAKSLDEKGKLIKKINEAYTLIGKDLEAKSLNEYSRKQYVAAYQTALQKIALSKIQNATDTVFYYYAGYFAYAQSESDDSMWKEAISNLDQAVSLGFKEQGDNAGYVYVMLYQASVHSGDTAKALTYLDKGFEANPNDLQLIYLRINYHLQRNESKEALSYIEKAKKGDPKNAMLLFAEATLHGKLGDTKKAIDAYDEAISIDPSSNSEYKPYYGKGVEYYNYAVKLLEEADKAKTDAEFEKGKEISDQEFLKAVAPMEKAHELNPTDVDVMETLKSLYYRLRTKYPEMQKKYDEILTKLGL